MAKRQIDVMLCPPEALPALIGDALGGALRVMGSKESIMQSACARLHAAREQMEADGFDYTKPKFADNGELLFGDSVNRRVNVFAIMSQHAKVSPASFKQYCAGEYGLLNAVLKDGATFYFRAPKKDGEIGKTRSPWERIGLVKLLTVMDYDGSKPERIEEKNYATQFFSHFEKTALSIGSLRAFLLSQNALKITKK